MCFNILCDGYCFVKRLFFFSCCDRLIWFILYLFFCMYLLKVSLGVSVFKYKIKWWRFFMIVIIGVIG